MVDFSTCKTPGKDYTLWVSGDGSHPFDIGKDVYKKLKYDALAYFYQTRSGIEIKMPYAGGKQWTRPAGHVGVAPNQGDKGVPCLQGSGCDYKLDVTGGWYDAGDQGKYVVNGGIAAWTLMNQYERAVARGTDAEFKDGKMNIPEHKNKIPDLLDEARWEVEFMLKMQVPDGQPKAGMVHHKIHDMAWTALGTRPEKDDQPRFLWPPSTAATLNLAATAAQCARVFEKLDKAFSAKCLAAAEKAWAAAAANPAVYAGTSAVGGGPYDDANVSDEFYWAAAELFITTKKDVYKAFVEKSPHFKKIPVVQGGDGLPSAFDWGNVARAGDDLAGAGAEPVAAEGDRRLQGRRRDRRRHLPGAGRRARGTGCRSSRAPRVPVGLELLRPQQRDRARRWPMTFRARRSTSPPPPRG